MYIYIYIYIYVYPATRWSSDARADVEELHALLEAEDLDRLAGGHFFFL